MFHIQELMDDEKCYEKIRALRWPHSCPNACPSCTSNKIVKNGCNNRHPACRRYRCLNCRRRFDDLTGTIFSGHHQPLRVWIACMHLMGLDVSNLQIAKELGLDQSDCQQMTDLLRQGIHKRRKIPCMEGEVDSMRCTLSLGIRGILGRSLVVKRGATDSKEREGGERLPAKNRRSSG